MFDHEKKKLQTSAALQSSSVSLFAFASNLSLS